MGLTRTGGRRAGAKGGHWVAALTSPPKHLDIFKGASFKLQKPVSDQFLVRVCSCPLCIETVCE